MHSTVVKGRIFFRPGTVRGAAASATEAATSDDADPLGEDTGARRRHQLNVLMPDAETREAARKVVEAFRAQRGRRAIEAALGIAELTEDAPEVLESLAKAAPGVDALQATRTALTIASRGSDAVETLAAIAAATQKPQLGGGWRRSAAPLGLAKKTLAEPAARRRTMPHPCRIGCPAADGRSVTACEGAGGVPLAPAGRGRDPTRGASAAAGASPVAVGKPWGKSREKRRIGVS